MEVSEREIQPPSKKQKVENDDGGSNVAVNASEPLSKEQIYKNMHLRMVIKENHGSSIWAVEPNWVDVRFQNLIATVGGTQVMKKKEQTK